MSWLLLRKFLWINCRVQNQKVQQLWSNYKHILMSSTGHDEDQNNTLTVMENAGFRRKNNNNNIKEMCETKSSCLTTHSVSNKQGFSKGTTLEKTSLLLLFTIINPQLLGSLLQFMTWTAPFVPWTWMIIQTEKEWLYEVTLLKYNRSDERSLTVALSRAPSWIYGPEPEYHRDLAKIPCNHAEHLKPCLRRKSWRQSADP